MPYSFGTVRAARSASRAPEMEMLHGALGQVLALRHRLRRRVALHQEGAHAALAEFDGQPHADRAAADDDNLGSFFVDIAHQCLSDRATLTSSSAERCSIRIA
jgi:hypothetical protein